MRLPVQLGLLAAALVAGTLLALALGADTLGAALTLGQVAFAAVLVALVLRA